MKKLLSASEIATMKLPGLPTSKGAIIAKADREKWHFEEKTGIGGTRRVYEVPARYLAEVEGQDGLGSHHSTTSQAPDNKVAGTIVAGTSQVDLEMLQMVETVLDEVLEARGLRIKSERRGAVVAFLYDYAVKGGTKEGMLKALQALVA